MILLNGIASRGRKETVREFTLISANWGGKRKPERVADHVPAGVQVRLVDA